jgi:transposase
MAYSQDLRDRVIDAVLVQGMSRWGAAVRFGVSETAAINWVKRVEQTGSRAPAQLGGYKPMILAPHQEFLEAVHRDKPDITLQGLCDRLAAERGVKTHTSVMSRFLRHLGVTLKKRRLSRASKTGLT